MRSGVRRSSFGIVWVAFYVATVLSYFAAGAHLSASATSYDIIGTLTIPSAGVSSQVATVEIEDSTLEAPGEIIGSYSRYAGKTFLFAHSTTAFKNLHLANVGDTLYYAGRAYTIVNIETKAKADISMTDILSATDTDTLILMTCSGEDLGGGDFTHRLIVTAQ